VGTFGRRASRTGVQDPPRPFGVLDHFGQSGGVAGLGGQMQATSRPPCEQLLHGAPVELGQRKIAELATARQDGRADALARRPIRALGLQLGADLPRIQLTGRSYGSGACRRLERGVVVDQLQRRARGLSASSRLPRITWVWRRRAPVTGSRPASSEPLDRPGNPPSRGSRGSTQLGVNAPHPRPHNLDSATQPARTARLLRHRHEADIPRPNLADV
jgi:hypothetical protein